uniref:Uncharacterized protein n=1 Tax=Caenorhabditis japonica TaxID=281687 RepID=A0A8R1ENF3_CAEJA
IDDSVTYVWTNFISPNANHLGPLGGAIQLGDAVSGGGNKTTNSTRTAVSGMAEGLRKRIKVS